MFPDYGFNSGYYSCDSFGLSPMTQFLVNTGICLIFLALITLSILFFVYMVKFIRNRHHHFSSYSNKCEDSNDESAVGIADKRYARGEITEEEYKKIKDNLKNL